VSNVAKIGVLFVVSLLIAAAFILRIENIVIGEGTTRAYRVRMQNAQGLLKKSPVMLRGVRVGRVADLQVTGDDIVAVLALDPRVMLHEGASASVASVGLLGERRLDLNPGASKDPPLPENAEIPGTISTSLDQVIDVIGSISLDIKSVTGGLKQAVGGEQGGARMENILVSLEQVLERTDRLLDRNEGALTRTLDASSLLAQRLNRFADAHGDRLGHVVEDWEELSRRLRRTSENLERVTSRLDRGEGAAGQLLRGTGGSGEEGQNWVSQLSGAAHSVQWLTSSRAAFDVRADYLSGRNFAKAYLSLDLLPPEFWFARFQWVGHSAGAGLAAPGEPRGEAAWSAMFGGRYRQVAARIGLLESRLGTGVDAFAFRDRLQLTLDAWDFQRRGARPHLRASAAWMAVRPFYLVAGWDDWLNGGRPERLDSAFLGAGLRFESGIRKP